MNLGKRPAPIIMIIILTTLMVTACSADQNISDVVNSKVDPSIPADMVSFEGSVFVATTKPNVNYWERAGWRIARNSLTIEVDQVPVDCTLYKHLGVEDQWIGSCSGHILIPKDGAKHIAVMHTQSNGTSVLVQVSPPSDSSGLVSNQQ